jgi:hypothetical protein
MRAPQPRWRSPWGSTGGSSCASVPPPVRAEPGMLEGKWLDEVASLVGKACPRPGAQGSCTIAEGPSRGDSQPPSQQPTLGRSCTSGSRDLRSRLDEKRAGEDARTTLERIREWCREAEEDHAFSGSPAGKPGAAWLRRRRRHLTLRGRVPGLHCGLAAGQLAHQVLMRYPREVRWYHRP